LKFCVCSGRGHSRSFCFSVSGDFFWDSEYSYSCFHWYPETSRSGEAILAGAEELIWYLLDSGRVGAYRQRTLVGTPGASHFPRLSIEDRTLHPRTLREVC